MRAAVFRGPHDVAAEEVRDPKIEASTDAIVRVVLACVCGSDLWFYRGISQHDVGVVGHEFIGIVQAVGSGVRSIRDGDFVIGPFAFSDGTCPNCRAGFQTACVNGGFFGSHGLGAQAELLRVPFADGTLVAVPGGSYDEPTLRSFLTLSDVMGTGHHAIASALTAPGDTVAVVGDGAVGLCAVLSARRSGAGRVIALSRHADRQALAREFGATDVIAERGEAAVDAVLDLTDRIGADAVAECVGTQDSFDTAIGIARPGSITGIVGVPQDVAVAYSVLFYKNVGVRGGPAPVRSYIPELLEDVLARRINPGRVFDFETDLEQIADAYRAMDERRSIKALVRVSQAEAA